MALKIFHSSCIGCVLYLDKSWIYTEVLNCALPELILKAEDAKKDFLFECIQIENKKNEIISMPKRNFLKSTSQKMKYIYILMGKDPDAYLRQLGYNIQQGHDMKGQPLKYNTTAVLLEF